MSRLLLAIRVFFRALFDGETAKQIAGLLAGPQQATKSEISPAPPTRPAASQRAKQPPARSEAITLLAALQREARLVDFLQEPLSGYSDAQIGAAVREVHRNSAAVIERMFALQPVAASDEGSQIDVPDGEAATRFHLVGNVGGGSPRRGKLCHKGWQATRCQLPEWTGAEEARLIVAPAEVELS
jgi:hypothetical protein